MQRQSENPCTTCGACCAQFRVSFHWSEADDAGGNVPVDLTVDIDSFRKAMKGTERGQRRCVALEGTVGCSVRCSIYERRPSVCQEFAISWADGVASEQCDKARVAVGLRPIPLTEFPRQERR
jgi:Fe-S-cluster containining protein